MRVKGLWAYPVKSARGLARDAVDVDAFGLAMDRRWGVRDRSTGLVLTARREPRLLFAEVAEGPEGQMALRLPDGVVTGDAATLSAWLGRDVELVASSTEHVAAYEIAVDEHGDHRPAPDAETGTWAGTWRQWEGTAGVFHDSEQVRVSLVTESSLDSWPVQRFRPNVVLDNGDERDLIGSRLVIGTVELDVVGEVSRCVMVTRPQPGLDRDASVLRRIHAERDGSLAVGAVVVQTGRMAIGDEVVIS